MKITRIGVDIAKSVFHVHGIDRHGRVQWQAKLKRDQWIAAVIEHAEPGCEVGMEACASSHHWGRVLQKHGFKVRLIAAQFVKPFVKSNKNDRVDAEAITEAMCRPSMRFVTVKSVEQQDVQAMHRTRSALVSQRTARANHIRGLVGEYGIVAPKGIEQLRRAIPCWLEDADNGLSDAFRVQLSELYEDLMHLDERVDTLSERIGQSVKHNPDTRRLSTIRGIGPLGASALSVVLGNGSGFASGRDFAASLGLVPRQHSTGGKDRLLGISKRGNSYIRTLLVHGARSVIWHSKDRDDSLSLWIQSLLERKPANVVAVALANKIARIAWAVTTKEAEYDPALSALATTH